jgi:thiamine-phosphate pyrophosphorylase
LPKAPSPESGSAALPALYPIVDVDVAAGAGWAPRDLARAYLAGGARLVQLRAKNLSSADFLTLATAIVGDAHQVGARVIINDRADLACLSGADGVHVGQDDLSPADVRRVVGPSMLVGLSTHTEAQIEAALADPISYLAIGPVFPTVTKATGYERVGCEAVRHAAARAATAGLPVVAIGGITLDTAPQVLAAGAHSVAIITDLVTANPEARIRRFLDSRL